MNTLNFNQSVGFPLETNILDEMQTSYSLFNALGAIAGNFSIISGCVLSGSTVADGVVFINGEVIEFKGGIVQAHVIIVETKVALEFEDTNTHDVIFRRHATFGTATTQYPWVDFKSPKTNKALTEEVEQINETLPEKADLATIQLLINRIAALEARPIYLNPIKNKGYFTLGDIAGGQPIGSSLPFFGDCTSAVVAPYVDSGNSYIDVTIQNEMPSVNYKVKLFVESLGTISSDNDAGNPVFKIIAADKFRVGLYEAGSTAQSIRIHFEVSEL